eukprot:1136894-Pelagomonas_calceolata.AAC.3
MEAGCSAAQIVLEFWCQVLLATLQITSGPFCSFVLWWRDLESFLCLCAFSFLSCLQASGNAPNAYVATCDKRCLVGVAPAVMLQVLICLTGASCRCLLPLGKVLCVRSASNPALKRVGITPQKKKEFDRHLQVLDTLCCLGNVLAVVQQLLADRGLPRGLEDIGIISPYQVKAYSSACKATHSLSPSLAVLPTQS